MPRALLQSMGNSDQNVHRGAAALEAGALSWAVATDVFNSRQPVMVRAAIGAGVWLLYERFLGTIN